MNVPPCIFAFALAYGLTLQGLAQSPPPNDNYANLTFLAGSDISFSGTLMGATREADPYEIVPPFLHSVSQTVWWQWTPTQPTTVIVQIFDRANPVLRPDAVEVYRLPDIWQGYFVAGTIIDSRFPQTFFTFPAQAGTNYQIQLAGIDGASFDLKLIATNLPYIVEHPKTQTVSVGDSVMFGVVVAGAKPFGYQWQCNGTNLPGETAPILGMDQITTNQAGAYRVMVTNSAGTNFSQVADLFVTPTDTTSLMRATPPSDIGAFSFTLLGEVGRRYRIQSSTNLTDWAAEANFPTVFYNPSNGIPELKSVVFDSTGADSFLVPGPGLEKFFRATPFHAVNEQCNNNLKKMRIAQLLYAYNSQQNASAAVALTDLMPYLKNAQIPVCPSGGTVSVTTILANPRCSLHPFEER